MYHKDFPYMKSPHKMVLQLRISFFLWEMIHGNIIFYMQQRFQKNVREILRLLGSIYTKTICRSPQTRETVPSMNYKLDPAAAIW
jgi:hypothetical protein